MPQLMNTIRDTSTGVKQAPVGNPLWQDILGFILENLKNAGPRAEAATKSNVDIINRVAAGKPAKLEGETGSYGSLVNPIAGAISPALWQAMAPEAKSMLTTLANAAPEMFQKVLQSPIPLQAKVTPGARLPGKPTVLGSLSVSRPTQSMAAKVGQPELANQPVSAVMSLAEEEAKRLLTPVHETTHFLNFPKVAGTDPSDAATIGTLLNDLLKRDAPLANKGSLNTQMGQWPEVQPWSVAGPIGPELLEQAKLAEYMNKANAQTALFPPVNAGEGYYKAGESLQDTTARMMMDEGLAYLAEQTVPGRPAGYVSQGLVDLAGKLNVGMGPRPNALQEFFPAQQRIDPTAGNSFLLDLLKKYGLSAE